MNVPNGNNNNYTIFRKSERRGVLFLTIYVLWRFSEYHDALNMSFFRLTPHHSNFKTRMLTD